MSFAPLHNIEHIPEDHIPINLVPGLLYHCSWAKSRGYVWRLWKIDGNQAILYTPSTNKKLVTAKSSLRHTNQRVDQKALYRIGKLKNPDIIKNL